MSLMPYKTARGVILNRGHQILTLECEVEAASTGIMGTANASFSDNPRVALLQKAGQVFISATFLDPGRVTFLGTAGVGKQVNGVDGKRQCAGRALGEGSSDMRSL